MIWKTYKGTIVGLAFLGILLVVYFLVIDRLVSEIGSRRNDLQRLTTIQESQRSRLSDLPELKKDFDSLAEAEQKIPSFLKKEKAVELIQEVEKLAEATGNKVAIEVATPDAPVKGAAKGTTETIASGLPAKDYIQLKIKVTGSFFGLLKLLNKLENSNYYLDVISLQVSRNQDPETSQAESPIIRNPFSQSSKDKDDVSGGNGQDTVSLINVVVYTQS